MSEEMHSLLGRYFSGQASAEEAAGVEDWRDASKENATEFDLMQEIWNGFENEPAVTFNTNRAWNKVDAVIAAARKPEVPVIRMSKMAIGVAASVLLAIAIWWLLGRNGDEMLRVTATASTQEIRLDDGSVVTLRKGATLEYPRSFNGQERNVSLAGEAFFNVAKNPAKQFKVAAAGAEVSVLGTSFSVNSKPDGVQLIVKTGRVKFGSATDTAAQLIVVAGERALLSGGKLQKEKNTDRNFNAWQTGLLVFDDTPLSDVARTISEVFGISLEIAPGDAAQISSKGVTIEFRNQDLESIIKELQMITTYNITNNGGNNYVISIK